MTTTYVSKSSSGGLLEFEGANFLRSRLVMATLSGKSVKIRAIRARDQNPGLCEYEASFVRLMDKLTNGSRIEVSETGTTLFYQPGRLFTDKKSDKFSNIGLCFQRSFDRRQNRA